MTARAAMTKRYFELMSEIRNMENASGVLSLVGRGPRGLYSTWPDGMPRGTNDPEAAVLQREDVNDDLDRLEEMCRQLYEIVEELGVELDDIA